MSEVAPRVLRVSDLLRYLRYMLESDERLNGISVRGEINNLSRAPSGHLYFSLKDEGSQVACVLFRREALRQPEVVRDLRAGMAVVVRGSVTVYEPRGTFQLYAEEVAVHGEGELARRVEQLRARLEREGLFAAERKRPLPSFPRRIALITSPHSQAYHDVLHRLQHQFPFVTVIEAGASVQGDTAADEMAFALDIVNRLTEADLILLVRGGGAPEELAAFNDERLVRAIFASRIPVITGIGHELDHTIADDVADYRAATPSLAAAAAVPDIRALSGQIAGLHARLSDALRQRLRGQRSRIETLERALLRLSPTNRVRTQRQRADELTRSLLGHMELSLAARRARLDGLQRQLRALDPTAVLQRGYAMVMDPASGAVISRATAVYAGMAIEVRVADGMFNARVEEQ